MFDKLQDFKSSITVLGDYIIMYNGVKMDTAYGKNESWLIIRKMDLFEEDKKDKKKGEVMSLEELESYLPQNEYEANLDW